MTIPFYNARRVVQNTGAVSTITVNFRAEAASDVHVYAGLTDNPDIPDVVEMTQGIDYTVDGVGALGYSVAINDPDGWDDYAVFSVYTEYSVNQPNDVDVGGPFGKRFEDALDRQTFMLQSFYDLVARSVRMPVTQAVGTDNELVPSPGSLIGWNEDGTALEPKLSDTQAQQAAAAAAAAATAAAAEATAAAQVIAVTIGDITDDIDDLEDDVTELQVAVAAQGTTLGGAMMKATYDPTNKNASAFDAINFVGSGRYFGTSAANYATAETTYGVVSVPFGLAVNLGSARTTKPVYGLGSITMDSGVLVDGFQLAVDPYFSNVLLKTKIFGEEKSGLFGLPDGTGNPDHFNVIVAPGANRSNIGQQWRDVIIGVGAARLMQEMERSEAIGQSAMGLAKLSMRNTAIGSLSMQWIGQNLTTDPAGRYYRHDFFWDGSAVLLPSNPAWDQFSLETWNPGIRSTIQSFVTNNEWATITDDVAYNVGFGRDTLTEMLKGKWNAAGGYRSLSLLFNAELNAAWGAFSGFSNLYGNRNAFFGAYAGYRHQTGDDNLFAGYYAGNGFVSGSSGNVMLGSGAGYAGSPINGSRNIFIGMDAGRGVPTNTNDTFIVNNLIGRTPLLYGVMGTVSWLAVGKTDQSTSAVGAGIVMNGAGFLDLYRTGTANQSTIRFYNNAAATPTQVGSITHSGTTTVYNTSSDERLKEDFEPIDAGNIIDAVDMFKYKWKLNGEAGYGPKAQQLAKVLPMYAQEGEGEPGEPGFTPYMYSPANLVPILWAETRNLRRRVAALEAA